MARRALRARLRDLLAALASRAVHHK